MMLEKLQPRAGVFLADVILSAVEAFVGDGPGKGERGRKILFVHLAAPDGAALLFCHWPRRNSDLGMARIVLDLLGGLEELRDVAPAGGQQVGHKPHQQNATENHHHYRSEQLAIV